jgi:fungal STAND N-terminal Goodbye domain
MSSTGHTTTPNSNLQLIIDALAEYAIQTGTDLSNNPFAEQIKHCEEPDAILKLLQEREKAFKEYRDANRRIIDCLSPAVRVLHAFSGILGEGLSLVSPYTFLQQGFNLIPPGPLLTCKGRLRRH